MILAFRAVEDIISEIRIKQRDQLINKKVYRKKDEYGHYIDIKSEEIKPGDVIVINDERVPADIIILSAK